MGQESAGVLTRDNKCHNTIKAFDEQVLWYDAAATLVTIGLFHTRKVLLLPSNSFEASECKWSLFYFFGFSSERGRPTASCWVRLRRGCTIAHCAPCTRTGFRTTQKNHSLADLKHLFEICRFLILSALIDLDECVETICEMSMLMLIVKDLTICCSILDTGGNPFIATAFLPSALKCNWSSLLQIPTTSLHQDGNGWQLKIGWRSKMAIEMF